MTKCKLGKHYSITKVITNLPALWISQSQKRPFLPNYAYNLWKE